MNIIYIGFPSIPKPEKHQLFGMRSARKMPYEPKPSQYCSVGTTTVLELNGSQKREQRL